MIRALRNWSEQAQQLLQHSLLFCGRKFLKFLQYCFSRLAHGLTVTFSSNRANRFSPEIVSTGMLDQFNVRA